MVKRKIIAILLTVSTVLSFVACSKEKKDNVKEDSKEIIEETIEQDTTTDNVKEDSIETEEVKYEEKQDKKEETSKGTTSSNNTTNKEENKTTASNTNNNSTSNNQTNNASSNNTSSNNTQQPNNNNSVKQETPTPQPEPTPTPSTPTKTYKVRGDLVGTVFNYVNNYTSTNLNKKLTLNGNYNAVGEQYIAFRIGQGNSPSAVNVKYTYIETDSINMIKDMPDVIGDRYAGGSECSVVVVENNGMYSIVFVSKY